MTKEKRQASLRYIVGVLSVEKRRKQAGKFPLIPAKKPKILNEKVPQLGHGTQGQRQPSQALRSSSADMCRIVLAPARTSVFEALCQFCRAFQRQIKPQAIALSFAIAIEVDAGSLLPQFSTVVASVACTVIAGASLGYGFILRRSVLKEAKIHPQVVRLCYNELWLKRKQFREVIIKQGGNPELLPLPTDASGEVDKAVYLKDTGHDVEQVPSRRSRRAATCGRKSLLSIVQSVHADPVVGDESLRTDAASSGHQDAVNSDSDDSLEDSDGDIEMFKLII